MRAFAVTMAILLQASAWAEGPLVSYPVVLAVEPNVVYPGEDIWIEGTGLSQITAVTMADGTRLPITHIAPTLVKAVVPVGTRTGTVYFWKTYAGQYAYAGHSPLWIADACNPIIDGRKSVLILSRAVLDDVRINRFWYHFFRNPRMNAVDGARYALSQYYWQTLVSSGAGLVARTNIAPLILAPWPRIPYPSPVDGHWVFDPNNEPVVLTAMAYRPDLADSSIGGEFRFLFTFRNALSPFREPLRFNAIVEYALPRVLRGQPEPYYPFRKRLRLLSTLTEGSYRYNETVLEIVTALFWGNFPERPFGNAQARINFSDQIFSNLWMFRSETLSPDGYYRFAPAPNQPQPGIPVASLVNYANQNAAQLQQPGRHNIPATNHVTTHSVYLAGEAFIRNTIAPNGQLVPDFSDRGLPDAAALSSAAGFSLAANTCVGCHAGITGTQAVHVRPGPPNAPAIPSAFLLGEIPKRIASFFGHLRTEEGCR